MTKIAVIIGSTRPNRFGPKVAEWFMKQTVEPKQADFELVDLLDYKLPVLDEPEPSGNAQAHTRKWRAKLAECDGYVFVTPEYNHALPGSFKNAIDFAGQEIHFKPVGYVSYGTIGGARSVEQWRQVAAQFNQFDLRPQVMIVGPTNYVGRNGKLALEKQHVQSARQLIEAVSFWASEMSLSRQKLAKKQ